MNINRIKELFKFYEDGILTKSELEHAIEAHIIDSIATSSAIETGEDYYWITLGMKDPDYIPPAPIMLEVEYLPGGNYTIRRKPNESLSKK